MVLKWIFPLLTRTKMTPLFDKIVAAYGKSEKIKVKDIQVTEKLLQKIISSGPRSLQVITDFDATLTRFHDNGKRCDSTYGVIANSPLIPENVKVETWELFHKYHPIEVNVNMTPEEKTPHILPFRTLVEWYVKSHDCFLSSNPRMQSSQLSEMVKNSKAMLRDNACKMLQTLHDAKIPTLILSAGMGNVVEGVLKLNSVNFPNLKIMANFMEFDDETGELKGFSEPVVHVYNKSEALLKDNSNSGYFEDLKCRPNVILMGDSLGDTNMANGVNDPNAVLKIGFLNTHIDSHLSTFMDAFDVVLLDDQSMDFANAILELVTNKKV